MRLSHALSRIFGSYSSHAVHSLAQISSFENESHVPTSPSLLLIDLSENRKALRKNEDPGRSCALQRAQSEKVLRKNF